MNKRDEPLQKTAGREQEVLLLAAFRRGERHQILQQALKVVSR